MFWNFPFNRFALTIAIDAEILIGFLAIIVNSLTASFNLLIKGSMSKSSGRLVNPNNMIRPS